MNTLPNRRDSQEGSLDEVLDALRRGDRAAAWVALAGCRDWAAWCARRFGRGQEPEDAMADAILIAFLALARAAKKGDLAPGATACSVATFAVRRAWYTARLRSVATAELAFDPAEPDTYEPAGDDRARAARQFADSLRVLEPAAGAALGAALGANRGRQAAGRAAAESLRDLIAERDASRRDVMARIAAAGRERGEQLSLFEGAR